MTTKYKSFKDRLTIAKTPNTVFSNAYLLAAYGMEAVGFDLLSRQVDTSIDQFHSPKARAKILSDNVAGIKTKGLVAPVKKCIGSLTTHLNGLRHSSTGFESAKQKMESILIGSTAGDKEDAREKLQKIKALENSLATSRVYNFDLSEVKKRLEVLHEFLENDEVDDPRAIVAYITDQYKVLFDELKRKRESDLKLIKENIATARTDNDILPVSELNKIEQDLIKTVNESYDKAEQAIKSDFETGVPAAKKGEQGTPGLKSVLEEETQKAELELIHFVIFSEKTKSKEVVEASLGMSAGPAGSNQGKKYRSLAFEDYVRDEKPERSNAWLSLESWRHYGEYLMNNKAELYTPSGLRLSHDGNGSVSIKFPSSWSFYYHYQDRLLGSDLMLMVDEIKRQGKTEITLTLTIHDPKLRQKIMEEFYYAAHLAGFPDDKIKFNVKCSEKEDQSIDNKTAKEIQGRLGNAPNRAKIKAGTWDQERAAVSKESKKELNRHVQGIDDRIEDILNKPAMETNIPGMRI